MEEITYIYPFTYIHMHGKYLHGQNLTCHKHMECILDKTKCILCYCIWPQRIYAKFWVQPHSKTTFVSGLRVFLIGRLPKENPNVPFGVWCQITKTLRDAHIHYQQLRIHLINNTFYLQFWQCFHFFLCVANCVYVLCGLRDWCKFVTCKGPKGSVVFGSMQMSRIFCKTQSSSGLVENCGFCRNFTFFWISHGGARFWYFGLQIHEVQVFVGVWTKAHNANYIFTRLSHRFEIE